MNLFSIKQNSKDSKCLIVGDIMLDRYIYGDVDRISPEAPIPVVHVRNKSEQLGGAANVVANINAYNAITSIAGVVGNDDDGHRIEKLFSDAGVKYCGIFSEERCTTTKNRIVGKGQQIVRFDEEAVTKLSVEELEALEGGLVEAIACNDIVVISDYKKGVCSDKICQLIIIEANKGNKKVVVDPKGTSWDKYRGAYIVTPNWKEFVEVAGDVSPEDDDAIRDKAVSVINRFGIDNLLITRSERGMTLVTTDSVYSFPTEAREVCDVSGAGDTVIATLTLFLSLGVELYDSVYWANKAAGLAVERMGTSVIGIDDLIVAHQGKGSDFTGKIVDVEKACDLLAAMKKEGRKTVFTNGCFDIIHTGHIQYLNEAKKLGDFLIVAINSDASVKRQGKGPDRPINKEQDRLIAMAALGMVDAVVMFEEDTPYEILEKLHPDILVKGGDYREEDIIGREFVSETKVLAFRDGYSTTNIINKIRG